jgi:hypothetical protein
MKNRLYACHMCNIHRDDLNKPNELPCEDCIRLGRAEQPCYHHTVSDEQLIQRLKVERDELFTQYPHLALLPLATSRIRSGSTGVNDMRSDPHHIEFEGRSVTSREQHRKLLEKELQI